MSFINPAHMSRTLWSYSNPRRVAAVLACVVIAGPMRAQAPTPAAIVREFELGLSGDVGGRAPRASRYASPGWVPVWEIPAERGALAAEIHFAYSLDPLHEADSTVEVIARRLSPVAGRLGIRSLYATFRIRCDALPVYRFRNADGHLDLVNALTDRPAPAFLVEGRQESERIPVGPALTTIARRACADREALVLAAAQRRAGEEKSQDAVRASGTRRAANEEAALVNIGLTLLEDDAVADERVGTIDDASSRDGDWRVIGTWGRRGRVSVSDRVSDRVARTVPYGFRAVIVRSEPPHEADAVAHPEERLVLAVDCRTRAVSPIEYERMAVGESPAETTVNRVRPLTPVQTRSELLKRIVTERCAAGR
jgi:hypothetical protein